MRKSKQHNLIIAIIATACLAIFPLRSHAEPTPLQEVQKPNSEGGFFGYIDKKCYAYLEYETGYTSLAYRNMYNNRTASASFTGGVNPLNIRGIGFPGINGVLLGLNMEVGEKSTVDLSANLDSGSHNLYTPAADQSVNQSGYNLTFSSVSSVLPSESWKYFVGYKSNTMNLTAINQTWSQDTFYASGELVGVSWRAQSSSVIFDGGFEVDAMSANWYDNASFNAQSKTALGGKLKLSILFPHEAKGLTKPTYGGSLSYSQIHYDFNTFQVDSTSLFLNLDANFK